MKVHIKLYNFGGLILCCILVFVCIMLSYVLLHNPHSDLHSQLIQTSEIIRSYYRDQPGYWRLSNETAKENGLIKIDTLKYKEYDVAVGRGIDGDIIMPGEMSFDITLKKLGKSACIGLSEMPIDANEQLGIQKISVNGTEFTWGESEYALPIAKYKTREICKATDNVIMWTFQ